MLMYELSSSNNTNPFKLAISNKNNAVVARMPLQLNLLHCIQLLRALPTR
jgi:hypothetical protein